MKKTCLLAFSGGLDSTTSAIRLMEDGHLVTLGFVDWDITGSKLGELQRNAAKRVADKLGLELMYLASVVFPHGGKGAKWSWVQAIAAMILWEAAYPIMKYDAVAFGIHADGGEGTWQKPQYTGQAINYTAKAVNYTGDILYPVNGVGRQEMWEALPSDLRKIVWCCNIPTGDGNPCGSCYKCKHDKLWTT